MPTAAANFKVLGVSCLLLAVGFASRSEAEQMINLGTQWSFAVDPLDRGEELGWNKFEPPASENQATNSAGWDVVTVPHDFLSDPGEAFTGVGWYRQLIQIPATAGKSSVYRIRFDQVSQRCRVWLNGQFVGAHEGGYTPFEFDLSSLVKPGQSNGLVVAVDNRIRLRALPGARSGSSANAQLFPWLNYGGILGGVRLIIGPAVYVARQQIETNLDLARGTALIVDHLIVRNTRAIDVKAQISVSIGNGWAMNAEVLLAAGSEQTVTLRGELPAPPAQRWNLASQPLLIARAAVRSFEGESRRDDTFGLRVLSIRAGEFLLNGKPIRLAGANRARGDPVFGGRDPDEAVVRDLTLMRSAGLRFARLQHTPPQANLLDWADRHGMLLILEMGVWGYPAADLGSRELRTNFQSQMGELIAFAANHPSVVAWSVGNEYESWRPEGIAWTRDMVKFVKDRDPTRPVTFAAVGTALREFHENPAAGEHAFDYVDFISTNLYFPPGQIPALLDPVHARWPQKAVFISEFGLRADRVADEAERVTNFDQMLGLVRVRPWICGLSFWSFNDYASRYPGTGPDGYRRWGLVDEFRRPRALYNHVAAVLTARELDGTLP